MTIMVRCHLSIRFQPNQIYRRFFYHRKAYVKNGKLSNPINNPKPKGAGASDAKNNTPEIRGRIKATTTE